MRFTSLFLLAMVAACAPSRTPVATRAVSAPSVPADAPCACASADDGVPIASVEVLGNRSVQTSQILAALRTGVRKPFRHCEIDADVATLSESGLFESVRVDYDSSVGTVKFRVHEFPTVSSVEVRDHDNTVPLDVDVLSDAVLLRAHGLLSLSEVTNSGRRLEAAYARAGRKVRVRADVNLDDALVRVVFTVVQLGL
jgi:outer membrane protein assembly factor BamA